METSIKTLQQDLNRASAEVATRKDENQRMRALLHQLMQETDTLRTRAKQKDAQQASDEVVRSDLRILLDVRRHARLVLYGIIR
jgi:predicted component of type VI protein secretion system